MSSFNIDRNQLPTIHAVVFDMDGLMLNTEDIFELAGNALMERRGRTMTDEYRRAMLGRRAHEAFAALRELSGINDDISDLMSETKELFQAIAADHLDTMPGLMPLLNVVERSSLPRAVATSSPRSYMTGLLERFDLLRRFPLTLTAEDVTHGKPHPEIYLEAAKQLGVAPQNMLVLEDSETGTRAAAAAGAFTVSVPNRHTMAGDFSMCSLRIDSLHDPILTRIITGAC